MDILKLRSTRRNAALFVVLLSGVDLLADFTYEGARSISGPFLALLGASGTVVGVTAGLGEFLGYALRLVSGTIADRTHRYWFITITGYCVNLFCVPFLALAGQWPLAAALLITERTGRAIRVPPRDAMLSYATREVGRGWGFGLHEAADQTGAVLGPIFLAVMVHYKYGYRTGLAYLAISAVLAVSLLLFTSRLYPHPENLEIRNLEGHPKGFEGSFWFYIAAMAFIAAGYADFPLMAYHFQKTSRFTLSQIPLIYSLGMGTHAMAAPVFGGLYDRIGLRVSLAGALLSCFFAPLVFWGTGSLIILGIALWGIGLGAAEAVMRAAVAVLSPADRRGTAYGIFNAGYGIAWFMGSALMGWLYDRSLVGLVSFSIVIQLAAVPFLLKACQKMKP